MIEIVGAAVVIGLAGVLGRFLRWAAQLRRVVADELRFHPRDRAEMERRFARVLGGSSRL